MTAIPDQEAHSCAEPHVIGAPDATPLPFDPARAAQIRASRDTLIPQQQPVPRALRTARDVYQQVMLKHPRLSEFLRYATYLHAALLEGDPEVHSYVPRPFTLHKGQEVVAPDCYVVRSGQRRQVVFLSADGLLEEALLAPLTAYLAQHGLMLEVIAEETILTRRIEAENWSEIVRQLHISRHLSTAAAERAVMETLALQGTSALGTLIDPGNRSETYPQEIALFRLLHRGLVQADLTQQMLGFDTVFAPCPR